MKIQQWSVLNEHFNVVRKNNLLITLNSLANHNLLYTHSAQAMYTTTQDHA